MKLIVARRLILLVCVFLLPLSISSLAFAQKVKLPPLQHMEITRSDDSKISAYISVPNKKKTGVILFLQGSICASEREGTLRLFDGWRNKYAVLYIEKPGVEWGQDKCPDYYLKHNTIDQRMWDIMAVISHIRKEKWFNGNIYVIGASEGGLMAGLTAANVPEVRRVAILSYGGGLTMSEMWGELAYKGVLKETGSEQEALREKEAAKIAFEEAHINPSFIKTYSGDTNTYAWWRSELDIRLVNNLKNLDIPIYLYHGELDQFDSIESVRKTRDIFNQLGKNNLEYRELKGLDHGFNDKDGNSHLEKIFMEAIGELLN